MKERRIARSLAAAVMAASILGRCGSSNTWSTTGTSATVARTGEGALREGTQDISKDVSQEMSEVASGKGYYSTFDMTRVGDLILGVMITSLGDSGDGPYLRGVMEDYVGMCPNVKLSLIKYSMDNLYTALITQAIAGTLPNIFTMTEAYSASCLEMSMNVDSVGELLGEEYLRGLMPATIENATANDSLVYIPWQNSITAMVYRKDLFREKGIQVPEIWDEFLEAARALTEDLDGDGKTDRYGCVFADTRNDSAEPRFQTFAPTYGCDSVTESRDGAFIFDFGIDVYRNVVTSFIGLAADKGVTPPRLIKTGYSEACTMIAADQTCMFFSASNALGGIYNANPEIRGKMGGFRIPTTEDVDPVTSFSSVGIMISNTCKNPEVAADFLRYMTSVGNSVIWNEAICRLPMAKGVLTAICEGDNAYSGFAEASDSTVIYPAFAGLVKLRDIYGEYWQTIMSEGVPMDKAIVAAAVKAENVAKSCSN